MFSFIDSLLLSGFNYSSSKSLFVFEQINEKQRSLYEALEKQQHYQGSLQSISSKMEALEAKLSEPLEVDISPDSHIKAHEVSHYSRVPELWRELLNCGSTVIEKRYLVTLIISQFPKNESPITQSSSPGSFRRDSNSTR